MARSPAGARTAVDHSGGWPDWVDAAAVQRLREPIRHASVGHAYLLAGPKGVGKLALARAFAQALCCQEPDPTDPSRPCGNCRSCRNVARGSHPDVELFDLEAQAVLAEKQTRGTTLTIETIRAMRASCALLPMEASRRVLILDDAETMQDPAQQALLKTLEEPPRAVTIVMLTDEPEALAPTILSRCQVIGVRPTSENAIRAALEARAVAPDLAAEIAALSRGRPAWAITASADRKLLESRREEWDAARSWIASSPYDRLVTAFRLGEQFTKRRSEVVGIVQAAVQVLRNEMLAACQSDTPQNVRVPGQSKSEPAALKWSRGVEASLRCLANLEANVRPRLALQAMVLQWPSNELTKASE